MSYEFPPTGECIEDFDGDCRGPVEFRSNPYSPTGFAGERCEAHFAALLERMEEINSRYPDSPSAPGWFDPGYAGERWDEDY